MTKTTRMKHTTNRTSSKMMIIATIHPKKKKKTLRVEKPKK